MSEKQVAYITRLLATRWQGLGAESHASVVSTIPFANMTNKQMSELIDRLHQIPEDPDPTKPEAVAKAHRSGPNGSAGKCSLCGHLVPEGAGFFYGPQPTGRRWAVAHKVGDCSTEPVVETKPPQAGSIVRASDGRIVKVVRSQAGRLYGKVLSGVGHGNRLDWSYDAGVIHLCSADSPVIDPEDVRHEACILQWGHAPGSEELRQAAVAHGAEFQSCMFCGQSLTDDGEDRSMAVGYGPVCAGKYGLPWG